MPRPSLVIVTPALASANNGNWHTAQRWARLLQPWFRVRVAQDWQAGDEDLLIALHAGKSAAAVAAWRAQGARRPLAVVLTGTDLYRDIDHDPAARRSLDSADLLLALNERAPERLPARVRAKCRVVLQSCSERQRLPKPATRLRAVAVGHLRAEKDPRTYWAAVRRLAARPDLRFDHIGHALDATLAAEVRALAAAQATFRWLGGLPHEATRRRIQSAHVLVHPSRIEGGANVVVEAMRSGTPVLASAIDGNLGLLGADYPGLFEPGDDAHLAELLQRARHDPDWLEQLWSRWAPRSPRFAPQAEQAALQRCLLPLLAGPASPGPCLYPEEHP